MGGVRMTGLISGMDTESLVKELVKASSGKLEQAKKSKQKSEWKKEIWSGLNTKLLSFYKGSLTAFKSAGSYKSKKATPNDATKVSVTASGSASNGIHTVSVKQIASSAYMTGANIKVGNSQFTTYASATAGTKFADMTDAGGNSLNLSGSTITIKAGNDTIPALNLELGGSGDNGVASIDELNKKLKETAGYEKLQASYADGKLTFTNSSASKDGDGNEIGEIFTVESTALSLSGEVSYKTDADAGLTNTLDSSLDLKFKKEFTNSDISDSTKLKDIGISVGTTFSIKGKDFVVDDNTTIDEFAAGLSKSGVNVKFDAGQGRFYLNSAATGKDNDFSVTSSDSTALDILGLGSGAHKIDAQDAIIEYNGVEYQGASNNFNINGLTITAKAVTGEYDPVTKVFKNDSPINIDVSTDTDGMYNTIKKFVKEYNELIDEMNKYYNEEKTDYEPLTEEEKASLSDNQIEKWEEKAKQGLLRRDSTLNSLLSQMRSMLNGGVEVTNADGTTSRYSLASLGIVTSSDYSENGKLHIMGDPDDSEFADQENRLKKTLSENPEIFAKVLSGTVEKPGLGTQVYDYLNKSMRYKVGISSAMTFYDNLSMDDEIDDWDDKIDAFNDKLTAMEDRYYKQFGAMETAMAKMQQQQSALASLMGM